MYDNLFYPLKHTYDLGQLPSKLIFYPESITNPWLIAAVKDLQEYLQIQKEWTHNFGFNTTIDSPVSGKMFGVLLVETVNNSIGYLSAFSGKLAGTNHHSRFVPPVFDTLSGVTFVNTGMQLITSMGSEIDSLKLINAQKNSEEIEFLRAERRHLSIKLQNEIFDRYIFINHSGKEKKLQAIFQEAGYKNPPSGAGECTAPKLLQYAFLNKMKPLAMAEFWWGMSPKSETWKHREFYPTCKEKCKLILEFMLGQ